MRSFMNHWPPRDFRGYHIELLMANISRLFFLYICIFIFCHLYMKKSSQTNKTQQDTRLSQNPFTRIAFSCYSFYLFTSRKKRLKTRKNKAVSSIIFSYLKTFQVVTKKNAENRLKWERHTRTRFSKNVFS